jgi:hypothetical protein
MSEIFRRIKAFIDNSPVTHRSKGTTFHETMTYFWAHMVHFCMSQSSAQGGGTVGGDVGDNAEAGAPTPSESESESATSAQPGAALLSAFKLFLLKNPVLSNGGLFLHYYTKQRMLMDAESRSAVLLPDKRPLPSLLIDLQAKLSAGKTYLIYIYIYIFIYN